MTTAEDASAGGSGPRGAELLGDLWRMQDQWSRLADRKKRGVVRGRVVGLALIVVMAVFGALSSAVAPAGTPFLPTTGELPGGANLWSRVFAVGAAGCAALLPVLRPLWTGKALVAFTTARQIAENTKSLVISWLALNGGADSGADTRELHRQVRALRLQAPELIAELDESSPTVQPLPLILGLDSYLVLRIRDQIDTYYRPRARTIDKTLRALDRWTFGLAMLGALMGAATVVLGGLLGGWIAVVTTAATAVSTHIAASQYRFQKIEFTRTAEQLEQLILAASDNPTREPSQVVANGEAIILGENKAWQEALSKPGVEGSSPG